MKNATAGCVLTCYNRNWSRYTAEGHRHNRSKILKVRGWGRYFTPELVMAPCNGGNRANVRRSSLGCVAGMAWKSC